ncbi:M20/M25/M40 family metallo-hydrolase [Candidatus Dependentiae bacterium]|nr:M20/M25/M40 family metallo-hydrolase [Candidatus Dependentiae bacterium]
MNTHERMIHFLQNYIRIETTYPDADYAGAVALLKEQALLDGFGYQEVHLSSGFPVVIITYQGSDESLPSLVLNHHMDVVPVPNPEEWLRPPFEGAVVDGMIIGRGTQDMKGVGVVHYFALKALKDSGVKLMRTIHLIAVPDEERGGFEGTKLFIETESFAQLNVGFIIDEGSASGDPSSLLIKIDERKPLQVKLTARGDLAHGSKLAARNAIHDLNQLLQHVVAHHAEQQKLLSHTDPGHLLSMNITSLYAGAYKNSKVALNVVSDSAIATIDIRIPPTLDIQQILSWLEDKLQLFPSITLHIEATVDERPARADHETMLYAALAKAIKIHNKNPKPFVTEGASDLRFYLQRGIDGVGFSPFTNEDNIHGTNEAISIVDMIEAKAILLDFLKFMCTEKED